METKGFQRGISFLIKLVEFILIMIIIVDCNSVYRHLVDMPIDIKKWCMISVNIAAWLLILLHILKDRSNLDCIKEYATMGLLSVAFCLEFNALNSMTMVESQLTVKAFYGEYFIGFFLFFMNACVILFRIYRKQHDTFHLLFLLEKVVLFLAIASLILWVGACVLELWGRGNDVYVDWGIGYHYYVNHLNLFVRRVWLDRDVFKNLGIFVEPPMYGLFLGIGLYTELFLKKKSNPAIVFTFVVSLISCQAILAILIAMGAFFLMFIDSIRKRKGAKIFIPAMFLLMLLAAVGLCIYKAKTGWGSFATHIDDFVACFKCWKEYPIVGCGYDYSYPIFNYISDYRAGNLRLSNSAGVVLAEGGIILFIYYLIPFVLMAFAFLRGNRKLAYWSIGMFLFYVVVIFHARALIFLLMALGYSMVDFRLHLSSGDKTKKSDKAKTADKAADKANTNEKKTVEFHILDFDENLSEAPGWFQKKMLDMPVGFGAVMSLILMATVLYGIVFESQLGIRNMIVQIIIVITPVILFLYEKMYTKMTKRERDVVLIDLWVLYIFLGKPYQVLNAFLTKTSMRTQDIW
ncbi:MAG: hypothetical protein J6Z22_06735, partial [Lachnospiraceae bacterium]|nr:hypothetical protein [Lachnospiraceae bacterium]